MSYEIRVNGELKAAIPSEEGDRVQVTVVDANGNVVEAHAEIDDVRRRGTPVVSIVVTRAGELTDRQVQAQAEAAATGLNGRTVHELTARANALGIKLPRKPSKAALIAAIEGRAGELTDRQVQAQAEAAGAAPAGEATED